MTDLSRALVMPGPADYEQPVPNCVQHGATMIRDRDHVGDGNWIYGPPHCPYCDALGQPSVPAAAAAEARGA